jgi:TonB family protein
MSLALLTLGLISAQPPALVAERYVRWERRLRTRVAELHHFPGGAEQGSVGDVVVAFAIRPDGRPTHPVIRKSSGNPVLDRAARRVVRLLGPIGPVPSATAAKYDVVIKLSYGQAATPAADRDWDVALASERQAHSMRNLETVTAEPFTAEASSTTTVGERTADGHTDQ